MMLGTESLPGNSPATQTTDEQRLVKETMERYRVSADFDRPFKDRCLRAFRNLHNVLPMNWPFWSAVFEPETEVNTVENVERIMQGLFPKDQYADLLPVQEQDQAMTEKTKECFRFVLRRAKYKLAKYRQMMEAVSYGNGVEFHFVARLPRSTRRRVPMFDEYGILVGYGEQYEESVEFWPRSKIVSAFDCYPATTGASIQEMPYFQHRELVPLAALQSGAYPGLRNVDKLQGFLAVDAGRGHAGLEDEDLAYDLYELLRSVGLNVHEGMSSVKGAGAVEYVELLYETISPPGEDGCGHWRIIGNRKVLLLDEPCPWWHRRKPYSDIKYLETSPNLWRARGLPALMEPLQDKLNIRSNMASDTIAAAQNPMKLLDPDSGVEDPTLIGQHWPGRVIYARNPQSAVHILEQPSVKQDLFADMDLTRASIQRIARIFDATRNIAGARTGVGKAAETATGLQLITQMMNQSVNFKLLLAEETGIKEGLEIYLALTQQVLTREQKLRIEDPTNPIWGELGVEDYVTVRPEDVQGQYDIVVVGSSQTMDNAETLALWSQWMDEGKTLPEVAERLKQMDAWLWKGEMLRVPTPRRFIRSDVEQQQYVAGKLQEQQQQLAAAATLVPFVQAGGGGGSADTDATKAAR